MKTALKKKASRRLKTRRGTSSRAKWGIAALAFLILLILFGKLGSFFGSAGDTSLKKYSWNGASTLNLVVKSDRLYVASFNPRDSSLTVLKIPDETYVDVPLEFGRWPMRSVYDLGQAESPPIGGKLLKETAASAFGVPVDGYLLLSGNFEEVVQDARKNPLGFLGLARAGKTDLNFWESLRFWWGVRGVRFDKFTVDDIGGSDFTSWALLPDGSRILKLDPLQLDRFIQSEFEDAGLWDEGLSVGIYNGTQHPGLADRASRVITNMGGRVVFAANAEQGLEESVVLGKPAYTFTRLSQVFAPNCLPRSPWPLGLFGRVSGCSVGNLQIDTQRADIILVLGEDYFARYNSR